ncbi:palmitoyltransferase swf1 [Microsporum ferrugineum]
MVPLVVALPYAFLYLSVSSTSAITPENHLKYLCEYPYDNMIFHPNVTCRTCHHLKPARSKHCSICKSCVARHDHHCVWLRTCVGRNNYHYFLGLLFFTSVLLFYGAFLGYSIMDENLQQAVHPSAAGATTARHWSAGIPVMVFLDLWLMALTDNLQIGAITLLSLLCAPLSSVMLLYHIYLIWSGMTTNESSKWGEWRDDIADGFAYIAQAKEVRPQLQDVSGVRDEDFTWPKRSDRTLVYTNGQPPRVGYTFTDERNSIKQPDKHNAPVDTRWTQVQSLKEIVNIYDLGFWENLRDSIHRRR